jgi:hypothetical protein
MTIEEPVRILLEADGLLRTYALIDEASVHLPPRGRRWIATYRDGSGRQFWRSTGLTDLPAALALAQEWEEAARRRHAAQANLRSNPLIRVRRGSGKGGPGLTQCEVALVLRISERAVRDIERRAIDKLRRHPAPSCSASSKKPTLHSLSRSSVSRSSCSNSALRSIALSSAWSLFRTACTPFAEMPNNRPIFSVGFPASCIWRIRASLSSYHCQSFRFFVMPSTRRPRVFTRKRQKQVQIAPRQGRVKVASVSRRNVLDPFPLGLLVMLASVATRAIATEQTPKLILGAIITTSFPKCLTWHSNCHRQGVVCEGKPRPSFGVAQKLTHKVCGHVG